MTVLLAYPFFATISGSPPVALSSLDPYLRGHGVEVRLSDLNIGFYNYLIDNWEELKGSIVDRLERRWTGESGSRSSRNRLRSLLHVSVPLISHLRLSRNHELLQLTVRDVANAYFLDNIFAGSEHLRATLFEISSVVDVSVEDPILGKFLSRFRWDDLELVGFSIMAETQFPYALLISRFLHRHYPGVRIAVGGAYITEVFKTLVRDPSVFADFDYLVVYEGESALISILQQEMDSSPANHPNVFSPHHRDHLNGPFHVEELQRLPRQNFTSFDLRPYEPMDVCLPVYSSKGCTWCRCTFCCTNHIQRYRERDISCFVQGMIENARQTGISHFQITDEDIPPSRLRPLAEEILDFSPYLLRWRIQTRFYPQLDRDLISLLRRAGCYNIEFGLESASTRILRLVKKGISLKHARRIISDCERANMGVILNCMVGFPTEDEVEAEETVAFLEDILLECKAADLTCNTQLVKIYKNSDFGRNAEHYRINNVNSYDLSPVMDWDSPDWVQHFVKKHQEHLLFNGLSSRQNKPASSVDSTSQQLIQDPWVSLSDNWAFLPDNSDEESNALDCTGHSSYLVRISSRTSRVFELTETMETLVRSLSGPGRRFSALKEDYLLRYASFPASDALEVLGNGLMLLAQQGAIVFHEN